MIVVLTSAGNSLFRGCAAASTQGDKRAAGMQEGAVGNLMDLFGLDGKVALVTGAGARSHRARSVCPLDTGGPYGCRVQVVDLEYRGTGSQVDRVLASAPSGRGGWPVRNR